MSIEDKVTNAINDHALYELGSLFTGDETARVMIVSADIFTVVTPPFADTERGRRLGEMRAWLDNFLEGGEITVAEDPDRKPPDTMLARVHPVDDDFWSIRVTEPEDTAGIRTLGAFLEKDAFIAVTWEYREDMQDFDSHVTAVMEDWQDIFETDRPFSGDHLHEYLTNFYPV